MKKHIASTLFLSLLSILQLTAQSHSVKKLGIEQGLSNNYVVSITQDKQGFLWFATEEGLNKFDGTRFITYYKMICHITIRESPATNSTGCMLIPNVPSFG